MALIIKSYSFLLFFATELKQGRLVSRKWLWSFWLRSYFLFIISFFILFIQFLYKIIQNNRSWFILLIFCHYYFIKKLVRYIFSKNLDNLRSDLFFALFIFIYESKFLYCFLILFLFNKINKIINSFLNKIHDFILI